MGLSDVKGQTRALRMLWGAWGRGRVASSYLFCGEQGVGKRLTALNFAKALNCLSPVERDGRRDACDMCASCLRMDSGAHPDLAVLAPEDGVIKVEHIRRLEETLSLTAFEARVKVALVDDAETMNISAANAFLKTLEEPAPSSLIILISSRPDWLPATIRSRCSRIGFRPLGAADCASVIGGPALEAMALAGLSMGRPGLAKVGGLIKERGRFMDILGSMRAGEGKAAWKDREDIERWFDMSLLLLRDAAVLKTTGRTQDLVNADMAREVGSLGGRAAMEVIIRCYDSLQALRGSLRFNLNKSITWNRAMCIMGELTGNV